MTANFAKILYASPDINSDILYATSFFAPDPFLYFECKNNKIVVLSPLESDRAKREIRKNIKICEIDNNQSDIAAQIVELCKKFNIKKILVPSSFPCGLSEKLQKNNLKVEIVEGQFFPERECKTKDEIKKISDALHIAENAMKKAENILAEASVNNSGLLIWHGETLTSEILRKMINLHICSENASAHGTIVACSTQSSEPHNQGSGPLRAGKPIIIDIFPRADTGYWGDITRTFIKWKSNPRFDEIYDAVRSAGEKALAFAKPDYSAAELHQIAFNHLKAKGFRTGKMRGKNCGFFHSLGHGVGLDIHEEPRISPKNKNKLKPGNVITIEPGLYYPDFGGVRIEDMILITKNTPIVLTSYPKQSLIK